MKTTLSLAAALAGLAIAPPTASAGHNDKAWIAVGSFLGGVLVGSHIERHSSPPPPVVQCPPPACEPAPSVVIVERPRHYAPPAPTGYWKTVQARVYTPERQIITTDRFGHRTRVCQPGFYSYETRRVWVDTTPVFREEHAGRGQYYERGYWSPRRAERTDTFATDDGARPRHRF
jgi:hypothetical protein